MHPMVKFLVNSIVDKKPIDWNNVHTELDRLTISKREREMCKWLEVLDNSFKMGIANEQDGTNRSLQQDQ